MKRTALTRRTPLARGTSKLTRTPLAKVGKKQRRDRSELAAARPIVEARSGGRCEFIIQDLERGGFGCEAPIEHLHHVQRRSQGGANEPRNLRGLCGAHHQLIHDNPAWALEAGWLARSEVRS